VPDADGKLPPTQLLKTECQWQGGVRIFFTHSSKNGLSRDRWIGMSDSLVMKTVNIEKSQKKYLWKAFIESLEPGDTRIMELTENIICTKMRQTPPPNHLSQDAAIMAATEQEKRLESATAAARQACDDVAESALQALRDGCLTEENEDDIREKSKAACLEFIERKREQDSAEYFAGQPARKPRNRSISLKSKNPEHIAKAKAREEKMRKRQEKDMLERVEVVQTQALNSSSLKKEKTKKHVTFSGLQPEEAQLQTKTKRQKRRTAALSLEQTVVHKTLPQPEGAEWKYGIVQFLQSEDVYRRSSRKGGAGLAALVAALPKECAEAVFFHVRNKEGLGRLFPVPEKTSHIAWPSTLELHRAALNLEGAAAHLLRACAAVVAPGALSPPDAEDLQAAWRRRGGICSEGPHYWPDALDAGLFLLEGTPDSADMAVRLDYLRAARPEAFLRKYLICDEVTWCMPYLSKLYFLLCKTKQPSQAQLRSLYESLTRLRFCALRADVAPLVTYGVGMGVYAGTLLHIAAVLGLDEETASQRPVISASRAAFSKAAQDPPPPGDLSAAISCRFTSEAMELKAILEDLGLHSSRALQDAEQFRLKLQAAMSTDSHKKQATRHLHPSPCLLSAEYDPKRYLEDL
jgi:hypothetical protein